MSFDGVKILGYEIITDSLSMILIIIGEYLADHNKQGKYLVCANPHSLVEADSDGRFVQAIRDSDLVVPDGAGIVLASKILGGSIKGRVTGTDIFLGLASALNKQGGGSFFFLGSTEATLKKIVHHMQLDFPNVNVVGAYSPPFKAEFSDEDNAAMLAAINKARPDVLWVGMTAPKQEKWIHQHIDNLDVKFAGAIGAVFDFYAGNVKRSHPVFQRLGLEWLPRLIQEPRRLWRRNFISTPKFIYKVLKQRFLEKYK